MEPIEAAKKSKRKWIIFGAVIAAIAILVAIGPVFVTKYMRYKYISKYGDPKKMVRSEIMIKVKGIIKQSSDEKTVYLAGENGLFYVLFGSQTDELLKNTEQTATVFGKMYAPYEDETVEEHPVRLRIEVTNAGFPDLAS